jgi:transcriptional regulator with XRE-family HTH domain
MGATSPAVRRRVGNRVRQLRHLRELTQEELAEKSGFSNKHVSLVELGKVNAGIDTLAALARSLSVDVSVLFDKPGARPIVALLTARELDAFSAAGRVAERLRRSLAHGRTRPR